MHKVSLLRNCTPILLLSKFNTNLKFRASTAIAWGCMKLKLSDNPELLRYKLTKTCRLIQQRYSSWNLFVYAFTLSVCKICILPSEKKQKKDSQTKYVLTLHYTPPCCTHLYAFELTPLPPPPTPPPLTVYFCKQWVKQLNPQICSKIKNPIIYKIKNSIVFTQQLYFDFQWYHTYTTCLKNKVYLA